jgi:lipopolysaccharide export system permease protein
MDEIAFREMHIKSKVEKDSLLGQATQEQSKFQWIKQNDYLLGYTNVIGSLILNPRLIKVDSDIEKVNYFKSAKSAKIIENGITFDQGLLVEGNPSSDEITNYEIFSFPLVATIPFSDIDSLSLDRIASYRSLMIESSLDEDVLFKAHLDKSFYKKIFYPFSVLAIMIFFGSFIFGSLRDSSPGSRIVFAVFGGFLYRIFQDLSISISISYSLPILIGVIAPASILLILSIYSYKRI